MRVWGSVDLRKTTWLNMYAQLDDAHVLALPLADTSVNMRGSDLAGKRRLCDTEKA
jgi:hypothetical protein